MSISEEVTEFVTPATYEWTVWKEDSDMRDRAVLVSLGKVETDNLYFFSATLVDDVAKLGKGPGVYVLICDAQNRAERIAIEAETIYRRVT